MNLLWNHFRSSGGITPHFWAELDRLHRFRSLTGATPKKHISLTRMLGGTWQHELIAAVFYIVLLYLSVLLVFQKTPAWICIVFRILKAKRRVCSNISYIYTVYIIIRRQQKVKGEECAAPKSCSTSWTSSA